MQTQHVGMLAVGAAAPTVAEPQSSPGNSAEHGGSHSSTATHPASATAATAQAAVPALSQATWILEPIQLQPVLSNNRNVALPVQTGTWQPPLLYGGSELQQAVANGAAAMSMASPGSMAVQFGGASMAQTTYGGGAVTSPTSLVLSSPVMAGFAGTSSAQVPQPIFIIQPSIQSTAQPDCHQQLQQQQLHQLQHHQAVAAVYKQQQQQLLQQQAQKQHVQQLRSMQQLQHKTQQQGIVTGLSTPVPGAGSGGDELFSADVLQSARTALRQQMDAAYASGYTDGMEAMRQKLAAAQKAGSAKAAAAAARINCRQDAANVATEKRARHTQHHHISGQHHPQHQPGGDNNRKRASSGHIDFNPAEHKMQPLSLADPKPAVEASARQGRPVSNAQPGNAGQAAVESQLPPGVSWPLTSAGTSAVDDLLKPSTLAALDRDSAAQRLSELSDAELLQLAARALCNPTMPGNLSSASAEFDGVKAAAIKQDGSSMQSVRYGAVSAETAATGVADRLYAAKQVEVNKSTSVSGSGGDKSHEGQAKQQQHEAAQTAALDFRCSYGDTTATPSSPAMAAVSPAVDQQWSFPGSESVPLREASPDSQMTAGDDYCLPNLADLLASDADMADASGRPA